MARPVRYLLLALTAASLACGEDYIATAPPPVPSGVRGNEWGVEWDWDEFDASCSVHWDGSACNLRQPWFFEQSSITGEAGRLATSSNQVCKDLGAKINELDGANKIQLWDQQIQVTDHTTGKTLTLGGDTHWLEKYPQDPDPQHDGEVHIWSGSTSPMQTLRHEAAHMLGYGWLTESEAEGVASMCST